MKQITLNVQDNNYPFFVELVKNLDFISKVEPDEEPTKEQILQGIREAVQEVKLILAGKLKGIPAKDFLNEL